jgi:hypothetical protein
MIADATPMTADNCTKESCAPIASLIGIPSLQHSSPLSAVIGVASAAIGVPRGNGSAAQEHRRETC